MEHRNALPAGTRLGEYEIETGLGAGGFGITYLAKDVHLGKRVALKEYLPLDFATRGEGRTVGPNSSAEAADYRWGLERFLDEGRALGRFEHPHINKVHRYFEAHGTAYLVLEYIEGETLSALLHKYPTVPESSLQRIMYEVLSGLEEVHAAGYIHRDIKPSNIMLRGDGSAVLLDFGAARQALGQRSRRMTSMGTPGYQPLEQYDTKVEDVGPWSDIYALGMVAYRCVSGLRDTDLPDAVTRSRATRKGSGDLEPAASIGQGRYDGRLLRAIDWAIQINEEDRPQRIGEWRAALPPLGTQGQSAPVRRSQSSVSVPARSTRERSTFSLPRWATLVGVVMLVVAVGAGTYWLGQRSGPPVDGLTEATPSLPAAESHRAERPSPQESPVSESEAQEAAAGPAEAEQQFGLEEVRAQMNAQMVHVLGGTFTMGCTPEQGNCNDDEKPAHRVWVRSFEISKYEVTQEVWAAVMGENPSNFQNCPQCPVDTVSWDDVQAFLRKLNAGDGRYRLPSEAEWEYVARGGQQSQGYTYAGSDTPDGVAWYGENSGNETHAVGQKQANELGVYDLSGNIWEWVQDCWNMSYQGAPPDGSAWERGDCGRRVLRGGSWRFYPRYLRSAFRFHFTADYRYYINGFRIARSLP